MITPYGGSLVDLIVPPEAQAEVRFYANTLPSIQVSERTACNLEMLAIGAFSPLDRFMHERDYQRVVATMRLAGGQIFPIPITLPVDAHQVHLDQNVALRNSRNELLAVMTIEEMYAWSRDELAQQVLGTRDLRHPLVSEMHRWGAFFATGRLQVLQLPPHYDFPELRLTPALVRARLAEIGNPRVVAFQTRNPLHRAHEELTRRAMEQIDGTLLLHPVVGMTKPGDVDHYTRVRTYAALAQRAYAPGRALLALLPLAMWMAGPREALWHTIIRRNYGASHFIVGRDHAGPGLDSAGQPFYGAYDAQELVRRHAEELAMGILTFDEMVYLAEEQRYEEVSRVPPGAKTLTITGTQMRDEYLGTGTLLPEWFTRPEVAQILAETYRPRHKQGLCIWFTGLSGAGKSTIAEILTVLLLAHGRQVTVLDGDTVRTHLSKGLGFSKEDRDTNVRRIGFVAAEIVRHGGIAVCAAVSPYRATRNDVRALVGDNQFVEVFVDTPLEVCEQRDVKGMYAKARRGELKEFTGIDDPYEAPLHADITLDTVTLQPHENAHEIAALLRQRGFLQ